MGDKLICLQPHVSSQRWVNVPSKLLSLILSRLYFRDCSNFKLVCKSWNLICPIPWPLPPQTDSSEFGSPCFMIPQRSSCSWKVFHSLYNDFYYLDFPELVDVEILFSYGWLLMSKDEGNLFFSNPLTKVKIELPSTTWSFFSAYFSSPPSSNCIVLGIFSRRTHRLRFGFTKVGESEWESSWCYLETDFLRYRTLIFLNGLQYYLDCKFRNIVTFDLAKGIFSWILYRKEIRSEDEKKYKVTHDCYMVEVEGDIWGVFLNDLGDKCLYVSPTGSFAETCTIGEMANKIYFNKFYGKSGVVLNGEFASKVAHGLTEVDYGVWTKPTLDQV
ncbi:hypothetical protein CDL12_19673 [Handroanthus impetiginosus]|uniref:KIB1-4 beta-propeller domain-containing protein n=1 Tax=Handroanthus impetiginosus TaxID=429701 RepID=A0A2G9GRB4_9LAMI|nr:hypothetical protein CDL12_19673 [Handroanthus impetiginosus]